MISISGSSMPRTAETRVLLAQSREIDRLVARGEKSPEEASVEKENLKKRWRLNLWYLLGALPAVALAVAIMRALPEREGLFWLLLIPGASDTSGDFASVLAPLLAVSVAIERLIETAFDWFEQSTRAVADVLATPREQLDWIGQELQEAYEAARKAAEVTGAEVADQPMRRLGAAEKRLAEAEQRLRSWVASPEYVAWKRALCIWVGLLGGLVIAILGDLGMFRTIGIPVPRLLDMVATGLVLGAGPGPMHSLIGMLQSSKNALDNLADLAKGRSVRDAAEALRTSSE